MRRFTPLLFSLAALITSAQAAEKPTLTVYTYDAFAADWGPAPGIESAFEATCDCDLVFVAADSSIGTLRKIQLEGEDTAADIVLGLDTNIAEAARATGLFAEHGADTSALSLPTGDWKDNTFLPFDYSYFAFVYNSELNPTVPSSFEELAAMPEDFKIIIQDPRSSTPGLGLVLWLQEAYGDRAAALWQDLAPHVLTVTKGWSDAYGLFLKEEADMVLSYTTSPSYHRIAESDQRFQWAEFSEGHYLQIEVASILKSSSQPELARQFMQFLLSDTVQDIIPTTNWTYPATETAKGLPEDFGGPLPAKTLLMDGVQVEKSRAAWIETWQDKLSQ